MVRSMTGYGRGETLLDNRKIAAEVRCVNHRFLDIAVRGARTFAVMEQDIKKLAAEHIQRGKVDITIQTESADNQLCCLRANTAAASHIYDLLQQVKQAVPVSEDITLTTLMHFKEAIFEAGEDDLDMERFREALSRCLTQALQSVQQMQTTEGAAITDDIRSRLGTVENSLLGIETRAPEVLAIRQQALRDRVRALCDNVEIDDMRMLQETALMADRYDITEEIVRARSHLAQFRQWLQTDAPVGRKLDFLLQELNREINTIGSKAMDSDIARIVVETKNELEKVREQIQNVM